jgi:hypothetical protein
MPDDAPLSLDDQRWQAVLARDATPGCGLFL